MIVIKSIFALNKSLYGQDRKMNSVQNTSLFIDSKTLFNCFCSQLKNFSTNSLTWYCGVHYVLKMNVFNQETRITSSYDKTFTIERKIVSMVLLRLRFCSTHSLTPSRVGAIISFRVKQNFPDRCHSNISNKVNPFFCY